MPCNLDTVHSQIDKTLEDLVELDTFMKSITGDSSTSVPLLKSKQRPKVLNHLVEFAEELVAERSYLLKTIEENCLDIQSRMESITEQNNSYMKPILSTSVPIPTKTKKK
jgi:hypothetical protein